MAELRKAQTTIGSTWAVSAGDFSEADIIVPVSQIEGMTNEQIGANVRVLVVQARYMSAIFRAGMIYYSEYRHIGETPAKPWKIDSSILQYKALLEEFADYTRPGDDPYGPDGMLIGFALDVIYALEAYIANKVVKQVKRNEIQRDYDRLFVKIGRRDGFRCQHCGSSDDLAIDHIIALANGGTNDLENLQLLCRSCNSSKGAR